MTDIIDLLNVPLTKWPRLVVLGSPVTREQATEIIIRTDSLYFSSNDDEFVRQCASYMYGMDIKNRWELMDKFQEGEELDWDRYQEYTDKVHSEVGHINLNYLYNNRIMSSCVGGPHGWCNWDGTISSSSYNIGEWPDAGSVYEEWGSIGATFPYLNLECQLVTNEGVGDIAVEYHVKGGTVTLHKPGPLLQPLVNNDCADERGCTYKQFVAAVDYTRMVVQHASQQVENKL